MKTSKNTSLISKGKITVFGNLQKKIKEKPQNNTHICNTSATMDKSEKEKDELFIYHLSEVFSPHNNDQDQEVEQDIATTVKWQ